METSNDDERRQRATALDKLIRESKPRPLTEQQLKIGAVYQYMRQLAKRLRPNG